MKRKLLTSCFFLTFILISASGVGPDQIAIIPKPLSLQSDKGTLKLTKLFRIFDGSSSVRDYAQFVNTGCLNGMDYKCINSSDERSDIIIQTSGAGNRESYTLNVSPKGIEINATTMPGRSMPSKHLNKYSFKPGMGRISTFHA